MYVQIVTDDRVKIPVLYQGPIGLTGPKGEKGDPGNPPEDWNMAIARDKKTKAALRQYSGPVIPVIFLSDVFGVNFAVYRKDDLSADNADDETAPLRIIADASGHRYRLMDLTTLMALITESFSPENL